MNRTISKTRKINGRVYRLYKTYGSGYSARIYADELRKKGKSVRFFDHSGVGKKPYALYVY